jgi:SAM-dependent methyltransferase
VSLKEHWRAEAERWAAWARTPGHDSFWVFREAFFELLPAAEGLTLEVGCGEGRVARDLAARGYRVVALDVTALLLRLAAEADPGGRYVRGDAVQLPFRSGSFQLVVAYNSLMDVDDLAAAVREAARVLRPGGVLCASVVHPVADAGRFSERSAEAPFVIDGCYLGKRLRETEVERGGLRMRFRGWVYSLEEYSRALEGAGLLVQALREPPPRLPPDHDPASRRWERIPNFLFLRALKLET